LSDIFRAEVCPQLNTHQVQVQKRLLLNTDPKNQDFVLRELISRILSEARDASDVPGIKTSVAKKYRLHTIPRNSEIFSSATKVEKKLLRPFIQVKPSRTISGVAPVAVMTSPHSCPHGICLPCRGGPERNRRL
jgi:elongator complex protein 3